MAVCDIHRQYGQPGHVIDVTILTSAANNKRKENLLTFHRRRRFDPHLLVQ
jgi:hypothetical protein